MRREELVDLNAFMVVAEEQSFTRAAAKLGTSQSALSYTIRRLEERLGVRLLVRTTRRVAPTEAGERLLKTLGPALDEIAVELASISEFRDKPAGNIRVTTSEHAAHSILWPALKRLLPEYPDIHVELMIDSGFSDIVAERFDAGVRLGESIAKDMVAVRIGPDLPMAVVGAPGYFAGRTKPTTPNDLSGHQCLNLRLATAGGIYAWGVREGWGRVAGEGRWSANIQQRADDRRRLSRRLRPMQHARGHRARISGGRQARPGSGGLVSTFFQLPSLLPEPMPALGGARPAG